MPVYLSHTQLRRWTDSRTLADGEACFSKKGVTDIEFEEDIIRASVSIGGRPVRTRFRILPDGTVESHCPCLFARERGLICAHVVAAGFLVADLTEDPARERARRITERQRAESRTGPPPWLPRTSRNAASAPASVRLRLDGDLLASWETNSIPLTCQVEYQDNRKRLDKISTEFALKFSEQDKALLYVLEDFAGAPTIPAALSLTREQFIELLSAMAPNEFAMPDGKPPIRVESERRLSTLTVTLDATTGNVRVGHRLESEVTAYLAGRRQIWALIGTRLMPLESVLPGPLRDAYGSDSAVVPRTQTLSFLRETLPALEDQFLVESSVSERDFRFEQGEPSFTLELDGSPELLIVRLWAQYGEGRVRATSQDAKAPACFPSSSHPLTYLTRNIPHEEAAVQWLLTHEHFASEGSGFKTIAGIESVLNVLSSVVPDARQRGWVVNNLGDMTTLSEGADWIIPTVDISPADTAGWFSVDVTFHDTHGRSVSSSVVEATVRENRTSTQQDGRLLLANRALFNTLRMACLDCLDSQEFFRGRISDIHAGYFSSMMKAHPEITLNAHEAWHEQVRRQTEKLGLEDVLVPDPLGSLMRPYQRTGVNWLQFLEKGGFGGILADEMGLGKTIQALAWLSVERISASTRGLPALVVCPTSLMHNWAREAARFTPHLTVRVVAGEDRHDDWDKLAEHDLLITSYALLRRDIERYQNQQFAVAILDEAQHIKNRSTQNAQAARQIKAIHRLVLTGTPMENAVGDLWSIMDYLMPGYMGTHSSFRESFEKPVNSGGKNATTALQRLSCKIQPFMLRRLKTAVATDLPPRITRVATCVMSHQQASLYRTLVDESREALTSLVVEKGYNAARMTVLTTLLRLRQLCCHPELLKSGTVDDAIPSAKLELFLELLDEAMDGEQRVLVFSQFVEMLHILRRELDSRGIRHAYLDGSTRNRQAEVDRFQNDSACPVFLISLKAGGTGLNLTGANVVIHFDPWWNPAVEDQATDRAHRIGQTKSVYSIKLVTVGTIEEKVLELQSRKRELIDATIGEEGNLPSALSWDDVQQLLAE